MKKVYALLALATSLSAFAGNHLADKAQKATFDAKAVLESIQEYKINESTDGVRKAPAAAPNLYNFWGYLYFGLTDKEQDLQTSAVEFKQNETYNVQVYGLGNPIIDYPVNAVYDPKKMTLTFHSPQIMIPAEEWDGENPLYFGTGSINPENGDLSVTNSMTVYYAPDGVQFNDGSVRYAGGWVAGNGYDLFLMNTDLTSTSGYLGSWKWNNIFPLLEDMTEDCPAFIYNYDEWNYIGDSDFTDGWLSSFFTNWFEDFDESDFPTYKVKTYQNYADHNLIMLMEPFGPGSPVMEMGINGSDGRGFIILDVTDPDCVLVRPNTRSGYSMARGWWYWTEADIPMTNVAGMKHYMDAMPTSAIKAEAQRYGLDLATMTEDGLVNLPDARVQLITEGDGFFAPSQWSYQLEQGGQYFYEDMNSQIQLPSLSGVNSIITDKDNAKARYFNLQGVEIANPEAGQVVIVKEGKNSKKVIF